MLIQFLINISFEINIHEQREKERQSKHERERNKKNVVRVSYYGVFEWKRWFSAVLAAAGFLPKTQKLGALRNGMGDCLIST